MLLLLKPAGFTPASHVTPPQTHHQIQLGFKLPLELRV